MKRSLLVLPLLLVACEPSGSSGTDPFDVPPLDTDLPGLDIEPGSDSDTEPGEPSAAQQEAAALRADAVSAIWPDGALPSAPPDRVELDIDDPDRFNALADVLLQVDRLEFDLEPAGTSVAFHMHSSAPNPRDTLVLYHLGHSKADVSQAPDVHRFFLSLGYDVLTFSMPMYGPNPRPLVVEWQGDTVEYGSHDALLAAEEAGLEPFRLFMDPVARAIAYAEPLYEHLTASGLSGGGWTWHVYAPLDPRIEASFPIAGGLPHDLRVAGPDWGDYEQFPERPVYLASGGFEGLYFLAAEGRRHIQILNSEDSCCFWTEGREEGIRQYEERVRDRLDGAGYFEVLIIENDKHNVHPEALSRIEAELEAISDLR